MNKCVSVLLKTKSSEKINVEFVPTTVQNLSSLCMDD